MDLCAHVSVSDAISKVGTSRTMVGTVKVSVFILAQVLRHKKEHEWVIHIHKYCLQQSHTRQSRQWYVLRQWQLLFPLSCCPIF